MVCGGRGARSRWRPLQTRLRGLWWARAGRGAAETLKTSLDKSAAPVCDLKDTYVALTQRRHHSPVSPAFRGGPLALSVPSAAVIRFPPDLPQQPGGAAELPLSPPSAPQPIPHAS